MSKAPRPPFLRAAAPTIFGSGGERMRWEASAPGGHFPLPQWAGLKGEFIAGVHLQAVSDLLEKEAYGIQDAARESRARWGKP